MIYFDRIDVCKVIGNNRQVNQKNVILVTISNFQIKGLRFNQMSAKYAMIF